jgi:UDPglucose 6-dehydrogenase
MSVISIIGSGYVGLTTGLAMAEMGNRVVLLDVDAAKVGLLRSGKAPFYEPGVPELLARHLAEGSVRASSDYEDAIRGSDITIIAVGTPMSKDGRMDPSSIISACRSLGKVLRGSKGFHIVVVKSTVLPGTTRDLVAPMLMEGSGKKRSELGVAMCPEFLREGSAMQDSLHPDRVVIGCSDDRTFSVLEGLFAPLGSPIFRTDTTTAEMVKYASNSFLATKISFSNEISRLCESLGIDVYRVMEGVGMDRRISPHFLRAGAGFGGSCFPKDVSALVHMARERGVRTPILEGAMENNEIQPNHLVDVAERLAGPMKGRKVGVLGLAFKPDTDDVRESRSIPLVKELMRRGADVAVHDPQAASNFLREVPGVRTMGSASALADSVQVVIVMTEWPEYREVPWDAKANLEWVLDGRRSVDPSRMKNVKYWAMGSPIP